MIRGVEACRLSRPDDRATSVVRILDSPLSITILPQPECEAMDGVNGRAVVSLRGEDSHLVEHSDNLSGGLPVAAPERSQFDCRGHELTDF